MVCPHCHQSLTVLEGDYCPRCGVALNRGVPAPARVWLRVAFPLLAVGASFLPWVRVGLGPGPAAWNLYRVNPWAWLWCAGSVAMVGAVWSLGTKSKGWWVRRAWMLLGAATFTAGCTAWLSIGLAGAVSGVLHAPNPVRLAPGLVVFCVVGAGWLVLSFVE